METTNWLLVFGSTPLEIIATVSAIAGVILIARENVLGWPLGLLWASISAALAIFQWHLISDGIMYLSAIPIQIYCWVTWVRASKNTNSPSSNFVPSWLQKHQQVKLIVFAAGCIAAWGFMVRHLASHIAWLPQPDLLWRDSTTTVLNYFSQFLQARKRMENWVGWLIVNLLGIHIYWIKESPVFALQYAIFLGLGIYGWYQWHRNVDKTKVTST